MSRILLGVSGGIAAYKALEFVREASAAGHAVRVVQTPASLRFVGRASFAALTGAPVLVDEFERDPARGAFPGQQLPAHDPLSHLELVANADVYLIAPASANTIAKLAAGLADNLLSSCALAARCPIVLAPAMNSNMYEHPATAANLAVLERRGARIVAPEEGRLASQGEYGVGRLAPATRLLEECERAMAGAGELAGVRVLVTAGGTREPIDAVRYVGNRSSGRMGFALAAAARERGAEVTIVSANVALEEPVGVRRVNVATAREMKEACEQEFQHSDVLLMAAAVADFAPAAAEAGKLKKEGRERLELVLEATPDILAGLSAMRREGQTLVGFAAEHAPQGLEQARAKLERKHLDALVLNDISRADIGFEVDANELTILCRGANGSAPCERRVPRTGKLQAARAVLDAVVALRARK